MEDVAVGKENIISEAIVVWTGWGRTRWPQRDEPRLVKHFGLEKAQYLMPVMYSLEREFYESDARWTVADFVEMSSAAASRFRRLHPELTNDAVEALAWCYGFDYK